MNTTNGASLRGVPPAALLLADSRFPAGAHAHSFGMEAAVAAGDVRGLDDLAGYVRDRLATTGLVDAAFASATVHRLTGAVPAPADRREADWLVTDWFEADGEFAARTPSSAVRAASRSLGRQMLRTGATVWPSPAFDVLRRSAPAAGPFAPLAFGATAWAAGLDHLAAAAVSLHHLVGGLTTAAVRLLGLDPFAVTAVAARLHDELAATAQAAASAATGPWSGLPATAAPLPDVLAEHHLTWEVRLFAS